MRQTYSKQHYELDLPVEVAPAHQTYGELTKAEFDFFSAHIQDPDHRAHFEKLIKKRMAAREAKNVG